MTDLGIYLCERETPFYNNAEGHSCGGESTGIFDLYERSSRVHIGTIYPQGEDDYLEYSPEKFANLCAASPDLYDALVKSKDALVKMAQVLGRIESESEHGLPFELKELKIACDLCLMRDVAPTLAKAEEL